MSFRKNLILALVSALIFPACAYIVLPEEAGTPTSPSSKGWTAVATNIGKSEAGDLHIDITIRNETADWSAMKAEADKPATLTTGDGKTAACETVFVSTGGHRLAPGFQMRGYTAGTKAEPKIQLIYVECKGAEISPGSNLAIDYSYVTGEYNYYDQEANKTTAMLTLNLDEVAKDVKYPIAEAMDGLIQKPGTEIIAINNCILTLTGVTRNEKGLEFKWLNSNPGEYPTYVHVGNPPVIGSDGIIYGLYESPDIASVPVTGAGKTAEWATEVTVPQEVKDLYILLSVESKKQRLFINYAMDITNQ